MRFFFFSAAVHVRASWVGCIDVRARDEAAGLLVMTVRVSASRL